MSKRSRWSWRWVVGIVVLIWVAAMAILGASGAASAYSGQKKLQSIAAGAGIAALQTDERDAEIQSAADSFASANNRFSSPVFWPLKPIPVIGNQVKSAEALTGAASDSTEIALDVLKQVRELDGQGDRIAMLRRVSEICADADTRIRKLDLGPKSALVGPLGDARKTAVDQLNSAHSAITRGGAASSGIADLMEKDSNYMFIAANNAEMRNGSGMFLQTGLLTVRNGKIDIGQLDPSAALYRAGGERVKWSGDIAKNWNWLGREGDLRNLMLSPRFDANAPIAKQIWESSGRPKVDGVIVVDVELMRALVATVGGVNAGGLSINKDNAVEQLMFEQYRGLDYDSNTRSENLERREGLAQIAGIAFEKFANSSWPLTAAAKEFGAAAEGRHILMWSEDPNLNDKWRRAGVGGTLTSGDTMVSLTNLGTNKLDQFMRVENTLEVGKTSRATNVTMKVRVKNEAPDNGPQYVMGPIDDSPAAPGQYIGMLTFSLPGDAGSVKFDGSLPMSVSGRDGDNIQLAVGLDVPRGNEQEFVLRFTRPADAVGTVVRPSAHLPAMKWTYRDEEWQDSASKSVDF